MKKTIDIGSRGEYPANKLSNFTAYNFEFDGVKCASMEGFLQSLKFDSIGMQEYVCSLVGFKAKRKGSGKNWQHKQILYWRGKEYERESEEYQKLLDEAYWELNQNPQFRKALAATGDAILTHKIGKHNPRQTVLTEKEFIYRLTVLRELNEASGEDVK